MVTEKTLKNEMKTIKKSSITIINNYYGEGGEGGNINTEIYNFFAFFQHVPIIVAFG